MPIRSNLYINSAYKVVRVNRINQMGGGRKDLYKP